MTGTVGIGQGLRGPAGLEATVYARGLPNVSAFALDARGRLWATTSAASDHRGDGVYLIPRAGAAPVKVISGLEGPLGLVWRGSRLYATSLGRVDVFSGLKGTRFAERKAVIVQPDGRGWNNGIVALPNGRLAMGISSACDHCASRAALVSEWVRGVVERVPLRPSGSGYASAQAVPLVTGFKHPLPVKLAADGALLVGDWGSGKIYRIARV